MISLRGNANWAICRGHIWYTSWIDRQSELCESYTQELIWCNFKLLQSVWGHHLNQRLSENHAGPFVFGATLGLHFAGNCVIKAGGVDCGLVTHAIE